MYAVIFDDVITSRAGQEPVSETMRTLEVPEITYYQILH